MKRFVILLLFPLLTLSSWGQGPYVKIGSLTYGIVLNLETAYVAAADEDIEGEITILPFVPYNGISYPVKYIGYKAFIDCSYLTSIVIPPSINEITYEAFKGCTNLKDIYVSWTSFNGTKFNVLQYKSDCFDTYTYSNATVHFPETCAALYKSTPPWNTFNCIKSLTLASSISLNENNLTLTYAGQSATLHATISPSNVSFKNVTWTSSNPSVATVDSKGVVRAVANGTATITVTTADGTNESATCAVTVNIPVKATDVTLNQTSLTLTNEGETATLQAIVSPSNTTNKNVTWSSSNRSVATVSNGVVTAVANGTATITVRTLDGSNKTATCAVTVKNLPVKATGVILNLADLPLTSIGQTYTLQATVSPSNATNKSVVWTSSNPSVAIVNSNGVVTAVANGTTTVKATTTDGSNKSATCAVTVNTNSIVLATDVTLNQNSLTLTSAGQTATLIATISPNYATDKSVTWTSSNTSVATVSSSGVVTATGNGTATITTKTTDGTNKTATCQVTVSIPAPTLSLNMTAQTLTYIGQSVQLNATVTPSSSSVVWSSNNTSVATVDQDGKVTAVGAGNATITATSTHNTSLKASCDIVINVANGITVSPNKLNALNIGEEFWLGATVSPSSASQSVSWVSSNPKVATVDERGLIKTTGNGATIVTAMTKDGTNLSATCVVTVGVPLTSLKLNNTDLLLLKNGSETLRIQDYTPANAANKSVTWTSNNSRVASVSSEGVVTGKVVGTATITATAQDGSGVSATCSVRVVNQPTGTVSPDIRISSYWFASGSMMAGSGKEEMHVNTLVPGSEAANDMVFVTNLLSTFRGGRTTCTPSDASLNDTITIVFDTSAYAQSMKQKGQSGRTYTMTATEDVVYATYDGVTMAVVCLLDTYNGKAGRYAEFQHNIFAHDLLNAYPTYNSDGVTTNSFHTLMTFADRKNSIPMKITGSKTFVVRYFRPINAEAAHTGKYYFNDASVQGFDQITVEGLFDFVDWRMGDDFHFGLTKNPNWMNFYGVNNITFNVKEVLTDLDGDVQPLQDVAPNLSLNLSGSTITYKNNGASVGKFSLFIPCYIKHYWGEFMQMIQIPVLGTTDKVEDITLLSQDQLNAIYTPVETAITGTQVRLIPSSLTLSPSGIATLTARVSTDNANKSVTWTSSNSAVATVSTSGQVTAVADGKAVITATANDGSGMTSTCDVTVKTIVTSITLNNTSASLNPGNSVVLIATVSPQNAENRSVTWTSSNTNVATVDANGKVTALANGNTTITVHANDESGKSTSATIIVKTPVTNVVLSQTHLEFTSTGSTKTLTATITPTTATTMGVTWTSSNMAVATVSSSGVVTPKGNGTALITATAKDGSGIKATCVVTVAVRSTALTLNKTSYSFSEVGETLPLTPTVAPTTAANKNLIWESSNTNVAVVSQTGVVVAVANGTAVITAKTTDGSELSATCSIKVEVASSGGIPGDVNGDGRVNGADIVAVINYVLAASTASEGDVNGDGKVNGADIVATINYVLNFTGTNTLDYSGLTMTRGLEAMAEYEKMTAIPDARGISVAMDGGEDYTAFQFILTLPSHASLSDVMPDASRIGSHNIVFSEIEENRYFVLGYENSNHTITGENGTLLNLIIDHSENGIATISDVLFFTPQAETHRLQDLSVGLTTKIENTLTDVPTGDIYDINGRRVMSAKDYEMQRHYLPAGVYIQNGRKFIVK